MTTKRKSKQSKRSKRKRVQFAVQASEAKAVVVTGDFSNWATDKVRLRKGRNGRNGRWNTQLELPIGEYQYRLLIDGEWHDHPEATKRVHNSFGTDNCILTVR